MSADSQVVTGGTYASANFGSGCYFEGCIFKAPCTFGEGCTFVGCSFYWQLWPSNKHTDPHSSIGAGATLVDCPFVSFVDIHPDGVMSGSDWQGNGTPPNCMDCASRPDSGNGSAGTFTDPRLVTRAGATTPSEWCADATACPPVVHRNRGGGGVSGVVEGIAV